jgi:hypothetical protein
MNEVQKIIAQLEKKRAGIDRAIAALREISDSGLGGSTDLSAHKAAPRKRRLSASGRRRIAEAARKRWAAQRAGMASEKSRSAQQSRKSATTKKRSRSKRAAAKTSPQTEG